MYYGNGNGKDNVPGLYHPDDLPAEDVFKTAYTLFLNAIKMVVGLLVLFSIAASVAGFDNIRSLGRLGSRVLFMARVFGIEVNSNMLVSFFITIMALSIGSPGVPGDRSLTYWRWHYIELRWR